MSVYLRLHLQPGYSHSAPHPLHQALGHTKAHQICKSRTTCLRLRWSVCVLMPLTLGALEEMPGSGGGGGGREDLVSKGSLGVGRQQGVASPVHGFQPQQPT